MSTQIDCIKQKNIQMLSDISTITQRTVDLLLAQVDDNMLTKTTSASSLDELRNNIQDVITAKLRSFCKVGE